VSRADSRCSRIAISFAGHAADPCDRGAIILKTVLGAISLDLFAVLFGGARPMFLGVAAFDAATIVFGLTRRLG
jgi:hypothetical protein